jgi:hypothetical protein
MDKFNLSVNEAEAFYAIKGLLSKLPDQSQYKVLRNVAHAMDREVAKPGTTRMAASLAGRYSPQSKADKAGFEASSAKSKKSKLPQGYPEEFVKANQQLIDRRSALKAEISSSLVPSEESLNALRALSEEIRHAYNLFRSHKVENEPSPSKKGQE